MREVRPKRMSEMYDMPSTDKKICPRLSLPLDAIPEAKKWQIGEHYTVELSLKQVSIDEKNVTFDICGVDAETEEEESGEGD